MTESETDDKHRMETFNGAFGRSRARSPTRSPCPTLNHVLRNSGQSCCVAPQGSSSLQSSPASTQVSERGTARISPTPISMTYARLTGKTIRNSTMFTETPDSHAKAWRIWTKQCRPVCAPTKSYCDIRVPDGATIAKPFVCAPVTPLYLLGKAPTAMR